MFGRFGQIFAASIVSLAMAASSVGAVVHAETVAAPTATTVTQVTQTTATATQSTTPTFTCATGIISTICSLVFGPICKDRCLATPATTTSGTQVTATRTTGAAPTGVASPSFECSPAAQVVCTVLGATICRKFQCGRAAAPATATTMSAPNFYCDVPVVCTVIALTICRKGCYATAQRTSAAAMLPPGGLCTINIRPINPFCLLP